MPLSCLVKVTPGNAVGFPVPPINTPDPGPLGEPGVSPIPDDVYEGASFSFDLVYQCYTLIGEDTTLFSTSIELLNYLPSVPGFQCTQINSTTLRIEGAASNVFTDAYYTFLMKDGTIRNLRADTAEEYEALVEWSIPSTKIAPIVHTVEAKVTNLQDSSFGNETKSFTHDVYWKLEPALAQFRTLLAKGRQ